MEYFKKIKKNDFNFILKVSNIYFIINSYLLSKTRGRGAQSHESAVFSLKLHVVHVLFLLM